MAEIKSIPIGQCQCGCGGNTNRSRCGFYRFINGHQNCRHRRTNSPVWITWQSMRRRCRAKSDTSYARYGGRGISVCRRWKKFENFLADMGDKPPGLTLDRIDSNGNYEPANCRWLAASEQSLNRRSNRFICVDGETLTYSQWERRLGLRRGKISARLARGWSREEALYGKFAG